MFLKFKRTAVNVINNNNYCICFQRRKAAKYMPLLSSAFSDGVVILASHTDFA